MNNETIFLKLEDELNGININLIEFLDAHDLDDIFDASDLYDILREKGAFDVDIIYYVKACEYLKINDASLTESLYIAQELGYKLSDLNSEVLASLLASRNLADSFWSMSADIDKLLNQLHYEKIY